MGVENSIDSINLNITSSTANAEAALNNLCKALSALSTSLGAIDTSSFKTRMGTIEAEYDRVAQKIANNPIKIKFGVNVGSETASLKNTIESVIAKATPSNKDFAKSLAKTFNVQGSAEIETIMNKITSDVARTFDGVHLNWDDFSDWDSLEKILTEKGRLLKSFLTGVQSETEATVETLKDFSNYMNGKVFYTSHNSKSETGDFAAAVKRHPGMFTNDPNKGIHIDTSWGQYAEQFAGILDRDLINEHDQLLQIITKLEEYSAARKDQYEKISELTGRSKEVAQNYISQNIASSYDALYADVQKRFGETTGIENLEVFANRVQELASSLPNITVNVTGITSLAGALERLGQQTVNTAIGNISTLSQSTDTLRKIGESISGISEVNAEGIRSLATAIGSLGRKSVTQAGLNITHITQMQQQVPILASLSQQISAIGTTNPEGIRSLATAIGSLGRKTVATAAANIPTIASNLPRLCDALEEFITRSSQFPVVREDVVQLVTALGNLNRVGTNLNSTGRSMGGILPKLNNQFKKAQTTISDIARGIRKLYSTFWVFRRLWNAGKSAVEFASDLIEVQNVVRNTFGAENEAAINSFAQNAINQFGMNELTAKQLASRYQAMGVALGYTQNQMSDMSIDLTALAGDMASFFNVDYEDVGKDLQAIFTGMTKPLRKYGIDITQATIEQWALTKGIEANMQTMTQAEKVMLRYQYITERLGLVRGDFLDTIDTWANQIRMLTENVKMLGGVWGGAFINAVKPFIKQLNVIVKAVTDFSQKVINALGVIFGWEIEITQGGITDPFEDVEIAEDSADGLASGIGDAAENAKELAKNLTVLPFDELNQLNGDTGSGSDTDIGSGSGAGDAANNAADGLNTILKRVDTEWQKYISDIDNLFDLGRFISDALSESMESIDWNATYEKFRSWGTGLAEFLNGLITPRLFGGLGETIAGSINSALNFLNGFGTTFNWNEFGLSIASGINNFLRTYNLVLRVDTFNKFAIGILDALIKAVETINWDELGTKIGEAISKIDVAKIGGKLLELAGKIVGALLIALANSFAAAPLETTIVAAFGALKFAGIAKVLAGGIGAALGAQGFGTLLSNEIVKYLGLGTLFLAWIEAYGKYSTEVEKSLRETIPGLASLPEGATFGPEGEAVIKEYFDQTSDQLIRDKYANSRREEKAIDASKLAHSGTTKGLATAKGVVPSGTASFLKDEDELLDAVAGLGKEAYNALVDGYTEDKNKQINDAIMGTFGSAGGITRRAMLQTAPDVINAGALFRTKFLSSVQNGMESSLDNTGRNWVKSLISGYNSKKPELITLAGKLPSEVKNSIGDIATALLPQGTAIIDGIKTGWSNAKSGLLGFAQGLGKEINDNIGDIASAVKPKGNATLTGFISGWEEKWPTLANIAQALNGKIKENIGNSAEALSPAGSSAVQGIASGIENGLSYIRNAAATVAQSIRDRIPSNLYDEGYSAMDGYSRGMKDVHIPTPHFITTGLKNLADDVGGFLNGVMAGINLPEIGVDWYAKGGYFPSPNVIGVGEAGHEAVLPLENPRAMREIANSIMGNYSGVDRNALRQVMTEAFTMALMNKPNDPINVYSTVVLENNEVLARSVSKGQRNIDYRQNPITKTIF